MRDAVTTLVKSAAALRGIRHDHDLDRLFLLQTDRRRETRIAIESSNFMVLGPRGLGRHP